MKRIGLLGGATWHSTTTYYTRINQGIAAELGPYRSADLILRSIDYGWIREARATGNWSAFGNRLVGTCRELERAGADGIFLCSNTLHRFADRIESQCSIPVVHIADALADAADRREMTTLALFGTRFTMTQPFYRERLATRGIHTLTPHDVDTLGAIILDELAQGIVTDASRQVFVEAFAALPSAEAMVLGCTEIGMLIRPDDVDRPTLDTTLIHADAAVRWSLED